MLHGIDACIFNSWKICARVRDDKENSMWSRMVYDQLGKNLMFYPWLTGDGKEKFVDLLRSRMVYPLGENLLFPYWLNGDGKEKLAKE